VRFAVSLFLRQQDAGVTKERLSLGIVNASNEHEAIGVYIHDMTRDYRDFPIVYHTVQHIKETT
jgi:hypothetical protein